MWQILLSTVSSGDIADLMPFNELPLGELDKKSIGTLETYIQALPEKALNLGIRIVIVALLFLIGSQMIRFIRRIIKKSLTKASVEIGSINFIDSCLKVIFYVVLILILAGNFGFDATSIVALMGSFALTIGLSFQGSLSNFAGGVLILVSKTFKVGDYIIEDASKNEGTVTEIGLFYTKLITIDNKVVIVPNGSLANTAIVNVTGMNERKMELIVGISYQADIDTAKHVLETVIKADSRVRTEKEVLVFVNALNASSVDIGARFWVGTAEYWSVRWSLLEAVKKAFDKNGVEIPFQQLDVHVKS